MPILSEDIKLMASERLTDNPDGGGRITGNEIVDGQSNNLFEDISDLDRTYGDVSLRKAFLAVRTDGTASYYGAHVIVDEVPEDDNVGVSLFTTSDWDDERANARDRIESYVVQGPVSRMRLLSDQLEGQRQIIAYQHPGAQLSQVGDVLCLSTETGEFEGQSQFVRVTEVEAEVQTFVDNDGPFERRVVTLGIGASLRFRFYGQAAIRETGDQPDTLVRSTTVAAISRYYATSPVIEPAAFNDTTVRAQSIFTPIVPAAQSETPVVDVRAVDDKAQIIPAGEPFTRSFNQSFEGPLYVGRPIVPGSLVLDRDGSSWGYTDNGAGRVEGPAGLFATVDYERGIVTPASPQGANTVEVTFTPGAAVTNISWTVERQITLATRGYNYTFNLRPIPYLKTCMVDYRAQGQWYRLRDNGRGELVGDLPNTGTGTINFQTGSVIVTLAALPDVDTSVIVYWGTRENYGRVDTSGDFRVSMRRNIIGRVSLTRGEVIWAVGGAPQSATVEDGVVTGDAVDPDEPEGIIVRRNDGTTFTIVPTQVPGPGSTVTYKVEELPEDAGPFHQDFRAEGNLVSITLPELPVKPFSFSMSVPSLGTPFPTDRNSDYHYYPRDRFKPLRVLDDGLGNLIGDVKNPGTIDYASGIIQFEPYLYQDTHIQSVTDDRGEPTDSYDRAGVEFRPIPDRDLPAVWSRDVAQEGTPIEPAAPLPEVATDLNPAGTESLVPNSVMFTFAGRLYVDRDGELYYDLDPATGAGVYGGTIDYSTGQTIITDWNAGPNEFTLHAAALAFDPPVLGFMVFRTPGAPLRPASTFVRANTLDGELLSNTVNQDGEFGGGDFTGSVDQEAGIARIEFPTAVLPASVFFNTVIISYLPLDADILGLDPVRLPIDGRVPAIKVGDVVVIHHTASVAQASLSAGQVLDAGRTRLASARIEDATGEEVSPDHYTADLDAGTVTMDDPLSLSAYTAPYTFFHRIEDMALASDVQINGFVTINRPLSHDFPAGETRVSSALIVGDMQARYANLFEQETWTSEYSDTLIGDAPDAAYNDTIYPIEVTNRGALTERWALVFTGSTAFNIIGESIGQIGLGDLTSETAPINPNTGVPYFELDPLGWGSGWSAGNVLRFDTYGSDYPVWVARTILQGPAEGLRDDFRLQIRGNANRP